MALREVLFGFLSFFIFPGILVSALYFPTAEVNLSLPVWTPLTKPLPPVVHLNVVSGSQSDVVFGVMSESTSGLFVIDGDGVRVNGESFTSEEIISKHQSVVVSGKCAGETANATVNLFLTGDKINCRKAKRNLCFWDGASFRIRKNEPPTLLGQLSSPFFSDICKNYTLTYQVFKGKEYVDVSRVKNLNTWFLSTRREASAGKAREIRFGVNCTVATTEDTNHFLQEFELTVFEEQDFAVVFELVYDVPSSNVIPQGEKIARGVVSNPRRGELHFSLVNDTESCFGFKCLPRANEIPPESYYECEITAKKVIRLQFPYTAVFQVEETTTNPHRFGFHNITLFPSDSGLEKLSLMMSTDPEESFMLELKYPDSAEVSRWAVAGRRIAEPILGYVAVARNDVRRRVASSGINFEMFSPAAFNVTKTGGIVFLEKKSQLKEAVYRVKISGIYPNGYRFISTMQINVTDTPVEEDLCDRPPGETLRPSCSEKRTKPECERTCGVSSGVLTRRAGSLPVTSPCIWRKNDNPDKLSRLYQTCSPDLSTCPDRFCDPLETLFPKMCPQDCTEYVFGSANKENHLPGIASATGVCSCDSRQKCVCALMANSAAAKQTERRKSKEMSGAASSRQKEAISAVRASYAEQCGLVCLLSIVAGSAILIFGTAAILVMIHRRRLKKRCPNQRPLKEDMVNMNYEEYVERPGDILRPLTQSATVKEIPEYFDKKWEFPRHRLSIEETIGEGEFGRVLKARADGIGGHDGSTTVAVKTLKDNAKESELADLISEYQLLKEIDHPNVIHLLGACTKLDGPLYIIIEYAKHGSLRNYLRKHRQASSGKEGEPSRGQAVTPKDILTFAWQIAKGMNYLTDMKLVHRDLAARNVLVAEGLICKISDFGLTRDIYEDDTYLKRSKGRVPVKWMALESLADHVYTTKSDVWSYGVVLWELVTTGASPYPGIAGQDLFHLLKSGYRMERPANCSLELYQILRSCWNESPSHRPTFKSLVAKLEEMLGEGKDYLDLNPRTAENKTYFGEFVENEERESFLWGDDKVFALEFKMFEAPKLLYENEGITKRGRYENEGLEDLGYVQPTGKPKPVNGGAENGDGELGNFNVSESKKELFDVKKI